LPHFELIYKENLIPKTSSTSTSAVIPKAEIRIKFTREPKVRATKLEENFKLEQQIKLLTRQLVEEKSLERKEKSTLQSMKWKKFR
jgi:hypothetical protein